VREPLGLFGSVGIPVLVIVVMSRLLGPLVRTPSPEVPRFASVDLPIFVSLLIVASAVLSLITIIAIYREGGILKRLRATPLRPHTILTSRAGATFPSPSDVRLISFTLTLLLSTVSILSLGFLIPSVVPPRASRSPSGRSSSIR
jgi:ABC-2 type transport system permease protein